MASSLETNKLLAAILTAGVIASGAGVMSRILYGPSFPEEPAYRIEVAEAVDPGAPVEAERPLGVLLAAADPGAGEGQARACAACHTFEAGGPNRVGPNLHNVVGRDIASAPGFNYSATLAGLEGVWDYEALNGFLADPRGWAPGTTMAFAGVRNDAGRADLILYLRSITDDPPPLPEVTEEVGAVVEEAAAAPEGEAAAAAPAAEGLGALIAAADPAAGERAVRACAACHTFDAGGANRLGPNLHNVVGRDIAAVEGFSYSPALQGIEGVWDDEHLDAFLADPRGYAPGNRMAFAGVRDQAQRADIIAYLRSITDDPPPLPEGAQAEPGGEEAVVLPEGQAAAETPAAEAPAAEAPAAEAPAEGLGAMIAAADPAAGERAVRACAACHTFDPGGANRLGPNLHNVVGRDIAAVEGFNYSSALQGIEGIWDDEHLDAFLADPRGYAPGNRMAFAGVRDPAARADIIAYLRSITEAPPPLPGG